MTRERGGPRVNIPRDHCQCNIDHSNGKPYDHKMRTDELCLRHATDNGNLCNECRAYLNA